jgi:hypothetical protein
VFHPVPTVSGRLQFTHYVFQVCLGEECNLPMSLTGLCLGGADCVVCDTRLLDLQNYKGSCVTRQAGERESSFRPGRQLTGTGFSPMWV